LRNSKIVEYWRLTEVPVLDFVLIWGGSSGPGQVTQSAPPITG